jgi:hypothetical protein
MRTVIYMRIVVPWSGFPGTSSADRSLEYVGMCSLWSSSSQHCIAQVNLVQEPLINVSILPNQPYKSPIRCADMLLCFDTYHGRTGSSGTSAEDAYQSAYQVHDHARSR